MLDSIKIGHFISEKRKELKMTQIKLDRIDGLTFIEQIMKPHTPYYKAVKELFGQEYLHGMAHITGGGIEGNLCCIIPDGLTAEISLPQIRPLPVFKYIKLRGNVEDEEMLRTFNCGVGFVLVVSREEKEDAVRRISQHYPCYEIGRITKGDRKIAMKGRLSWL